MLIEDRFMQELKHHEPILVTEEGKSIDSKLVQPKKQNPSRVFRWLDDVRSSEVKLEHP
jgi:hypothetical protein